MKKIPVSLKARSYPIVIGRGLLPKIAALLKPLHLGPKILIVTNRRIGSLYLKPIVSSLKKAGFDVYSHYLPYGNERDKSQPVLIQLLSKMALIPLERSSTVLALGGGVVGDLAGFAASIFMRGISVIQVPTTLLAQVDSAIGGKTAINLPEAKNSVGTFHQPKMVISDLSVLQTQSPQEFLNSFAEVVKCGVIWDAKLFSLLERKPETFYRNLFQGRHFTAEQFAFLEEVIVRSSSVKAYVVSADEHETKGLRMILNYGHTFAHAYETASHYQIPHGAAVSIGMILAAKLAYRLGLCSEQVELRQLQLIRKIGLPEVKEAKKYGPFRSKQLIFSMKRDKKVRNGKLRFVLPVKIGKVKTVQGVSEIEVERLLEFFQ